ncbi:MAG TPA: radical SAM protein, partial [Chthoniobacterales bacterium]|nr:radical SAM protein [Chthoniobacterales bacterium]
LFLRQADGALKQVPFGFPRADVARAFPECACGERVGYRASLFPPLPQLSGVTFCCQINDEWHQFSANLETRDVQSFAFDASTQAPAEVIEQLRAATEEPLEAHFRRALAARPGLTLRLDIINKCNLRCVMCHFSDDAIFKRPTRQLTADEFQHMFDEIGEHVGHVVLSCGDEPLTSKFLPDIIRYLAREHPQVAIEFCTNAMLMRAPIRRLIMETGVARLMFSIDAVSKPLLESIRVGARYEQLVGNIMALRDLRTRLGRTFPEFVFNFVMMNRNIHEAPAFVRMAKELGAAVIDFRHLVPIETYFDPQELLSLYPAKFNHYREKIAAAAKAAEVNYYIPEPFPTNETWLPQNEPAVDWSAFENVRAEQDDIDIGAVPAAAPRLGEEGTVAEEFGATFCNRPFSEIMIRDQEDVLPCPWHNNVLGRLSEGKTLAEIFHGEKFAALRRNMLRAEGDPHCRECPIKTAHLPTAKNT